MLKVVLVPKKGRGVVATQYIKKGTLIEAAPTCSFPTQQRELVDKTNLSIFYFVKPSEYTATNKNVEGHIVFGLSSFTNHSKTPNAKIEWKEDERGLWANLVALEDIQVDNEVTIFYTNIDTYTLADSFIEN